MPILGSAVLYMIMSFFNIFVCYISKIVRSILSPFKFKEFYFCKEYIFIKIEFIYDRKENTRVNII